MMNLELSVPHEKAPFRGMLIGYARVSTPEQNLDLQIDALKAAGCERHFSDVASGSRDARLGLSQTLEALRPGDTLVVWRLDRLGRSLRHLLATVQELEARGVGFKSLQESIDTTTPGGKLVFHVFGAMAEFERELIRERTQAGLKAARSRGRTGGRKAALSPDQIEMLLKLAGDNVPIPQICKLFSISERTYFRYLERSSTKPKT